MEDLENLYRRDLLFSFKGDMERLGFTQEDITKVRSIIEKDEMMPKFILNSQVRNVTDLIFSVKVNFCSEIIFGFTK